MTGRTYRNLAAAVAVIALIIGGAAGVSAQKKGGTIRVGNLGEPPTLDAHWTTASITETLTNHIYEGLLTLDDENKPIPMLAEAMPTVSPDGLTYTFKLRHGIKFHNGKEMTSDDVVASLTRWSKQSIYGKDLFTYVAEGGLRGVDKYTVGAEAEGEGGDRPDQPGGGQQLRRDLPEGDRREVPAGREGHGVRRGPAPSSSSSGSPISTSRWFASTTTSPGARSPTATAAPKIVYVDEIRWIPVPDVATRVAQMETGELELADDLNADAYDRLKASANARPIISKLYYWLVAVLNKKEGLMTNQKLRQAWQAALDIEPIMKTVAAGRSEFYRMDYNLIHQEMGAWHVKMQGLPWNEHNKEKAKKLLQEAGLQGRADPLHGDPGVQVDVRLRPRLEAAAGGYGFQHRPAGRGLGHPREAAQQPKEYDAFTTGIGPQYDPTNSNVLSCSWPGWTCDEQIQTIKTAMIRETDYKKRFALWEQMHKAFYEKVPVIRYGDLFGLRAASKKVQGPEREDGAGCVSGTSRWTSSLRLIA
jgi:peptide/nickel transport system substrate-binding protein